MTENEAIKIIGEVSVSINSKNTLSEIRKAYDVVKNAVEEIQEYRAIGTVEEFKALKEKSEPKKIVRFEDGDKCPICNHWVGFRYDYCDGCGNALDWN